MNLTEKVLITLLSLSSLHLNGQEIESIKKLLKPQEVIDYAFDKSQIVMINEAHNGQKRNVRTRIIGQLILPKAHAHGVRVLAMEALNKSFTEEANNTRVLPYADPINGGYLHQSDLRDLMQSALDLGWNLISYEADIEKRPKLDKQIDRSNWRENKQAENLANILKNLGEHTKILVWCGNSHHSKEPGDTPIGVLYPMGHQFWTITNIEPFIIDQIITVEFHEGNNTFQKWIEYENELKNYFYGTLGFIDENNKSAILISLHNTLD